MRAARLALGTILASVSALGCASSQPAASPPLTVHVFNTISNVVVTSATLAIVSSPDPHDQTVVPPCGGNVEVAAPNRHGSGGILYLMLDPSGSADKAYAAGGVEAVSSGDFSGSILWSSAELKEGDWVTVTPNLVTVTTSAPAAPASCAPWTYSDPTPEAQ
jgi:hypothetical protein